MVISIALCAALSVGQQTSKADKLIVGYVPNWGDLPGFAKKFDYSKVTHLNLAFENPIDDAGNLSFNLADKDLVEQAHAHKVKVLISIGGGAASGDKVLMDRYFSLLTDAKRPAFVAKIVEYVQGHGFDGLDVDIEGPSINKDYGGFVHDLSLALKPKGKLLTAALSQGYGGDQVPDSAFADFDFVNVMAYDGTGPWNPNQPGQHSSMDMAIGAVRYWLGRGLTKDKTVLGLPFYGYGFGKAYRNGDYPYSEIVKSYSGAESQDQVGETIWYNGIPTIQAKVKYVKDEGLAGVMIWELASDADGEKSLLKAVFEALKG